MAFRATQTAIVIDTLITDLVHEAIDQRLTLKEPYGTKSRPCQRLCDILGIMPCIMEDDDEDDDKNEKRVNFNDIDVIIPMDPSSIEGRHQWHSWLVEAMAADSSEDELEIYRKQRSSIKFSNSACQTEQPRFRKRHPCVSTPGDRALRAVPAPCELNRQTIFIDAMSVPTPSLQHRPPLGDRFCYMLTDFASALYCSLAIMCCCTPNMFR